MKPRLPIILCLCVLLLSCESRIDKDLQFGESKVAIDALLTVDAETQLVRVSRSSTLNAGIEAVNNAAVTLFDESGISYTFTEDEAKPGDYIYEMDIDIDMNSTYQLHVEADGVLHTAESEVAEVVKTIPEAQYQVIDSVTRALTEFIPYFTEEEQAMYRIDLDWSHLQPDTTNKARVYYYSFNDIDVGSLLPGETERVLFPVGTIITISKYGLTDDFAEFLRAAIIESRWTGGIYFNASSSLPTNFSQEALGYFSISETFSQTFTVQ